MTAGHFKHGFMRLINAESAAPYSYMGFFIKNAEAFFNGKAKAEEVGINVVDDATLQISAAYVQRGSLNFRSPCAILQLTGFAASGIFANEFSSCPESQVLVNQI